ncbi:glutathione S-transferase zeta class isoform X1 [Pyrus x bretschneideri]|uniref:glutathione S-transferase zeta class isoform X1 n=1 Tax=Pyrus x bretschneideri TaxID=225117 RepID=UPI000510A821|nr:glutathione S-transferase zeta class isoform X1 [Pyrus x bretschneideri]XP_009355411.1 glutathione S-transferase zeta class isoform X1 [Pyrus x bretschneideri]
MITITNDKMEAQEVEAQAATESGQQQLKLYSYWMSSCSFRVRIALNLKGLKYEYKALVKGEQFSPEFRKLNPMGYVPVLVDGDTVVADSFAILLYLEEKYPQHPLLPPDLQKKAINYQAANIVSSSIQPLQNLTVLKYIEEKVRPVEKLEWVQFHIGKGFLALEELLNNHAGKYATGDEVYMADLFLAPQLCAAITRFQLDMTQFPLLARLHEAYNKIPAFLDALPEKQPDAPSS